MESSQSKGASGVERLTGHKDGCPHLYFDQGACACKGRWVRAVPMRRATWLELLLDRWIGPRTGHPWRSVLKGLTRRA